jgi:fibronectin-binding autotransporter adhesin
LLEALRGEPETKMAVTRINNNQVTNAQSGNLYVGINAGTKLQNFSITSTKIANNLTYDSNLTITGNLTVQGNTTAIDTTITTIEDPILLLGSGQTGSPTVDIGYIGQRGTSENIAFVWDESAGEFVTAFTSTAESNTVITITSYANLHSANTFVGGSLSVSGNTSLTGNIISDLNVTGNITGANITTVGLISSTGTVTGGNIATSGTVSSTGTATVGNLATGGTVSATGTITGGNINTAGNVSATGNITAANFFGNISGNISIGGSNTDVLFNDNGLANATAGFRFDKTTNAVTVTGTVSSLGTVTGGNLATGGTVSATGDITGANVSASGNVIPTANITYTLGSSTAYWKSLYVSGNGTVYLGSLQVREPVANTFAVYRADSVTLANFNTGPLTAEGNITGGNLLTGGLVSSTGTVTGGNLATGGTASVSGTVTGGNLNTGGTVSATGTITSANTITGGNLATGGTVSATGTATAGNVATGGTISATGTATVGNLATGGTASATGTATVGNLVTGGTVSATSTVTGGNIDTSGTISATGTATVGNLATGGTVSGTGTGTFGNVNTGGTVSATGTATLGNVDTGGTISAAGTATVGNVATGGTVSAAGTVTGGNLATAGTASATGNITTSNYFLGNGAFLTGVTASAVDANNLIGNTLSPNVLFSSLTSVGTLTSLSATGTATVGNVATGGTVSATSTVTGGNIATGGTASAGGNITGANILTGGLVSATGNITGANVNTAQLYSSSGLSIVNASGNINIEPAANVVLNGKQILGLALTPVGNTAATSKFYVDQLVTTAISYHEAVVAATNTTLATATGGTITYTQPNGVSNGVGAYIQTTGSFTTIDTANVQTVGTRILVKDEGNAVFNGVYVYSNATAITRASTEDTYGAASANTFSINDYFFVTSGNVNAGSAWIVDAPAGVITFGTSEIQFAQFSQTQVYTEGNGIDINGTVISARVDNNTTAFDGFGNIVVKAGANLTTPNIGAATGTSLSTTGTITGGNLDTGGTVSATSTITGGNLATGGTISATGTATLGNVATGGTISATGNITGNYFIGNGSQLTGVTASSVDANNLTGTTLASSVVNSSLTSVGALTSLSVVGTTTSGNIVTGGTVSATGTATVGNVATGGTVSATGTGTFGNLATGGTVSATGTATVGNLATGGTVSATGTIDSANTITGGNLATGGTISSTGTATVGNVATGGTVSATSTVTGGNLATGGTISATGTATLGNVDTGGTISATGTATLGNVATGGTISATGTATLGNVATGGTISATGTATVGNLATGGTASVGGNITGGNLLTGGLVSSTGTVTGGNLETGGTVSAVGSATVGNLVTGGIVSATSTVTGGNLATSGTISATGTATVGNLGTGGTVSSTGNILTSANVSATGNVFAANFIGNISGNISSPGANTEVIFNDNGTANAVSGFTFNKTSNLVTVGGNVDAINFNGNVFATSVSASGTVTAASTVGGVITGSSASVTGTVTAASTVGGVITGSTASLTGNVDSANLILSSGFIDGPAAGRITINGSDIDTDFAVDGDTLANVFYVDAGTGTASFGSSSQTVNAIVAFNATNSILTPVGNTAQRPSTGVTGMFRFNTITNSLEVYDNTQWTSVGVPSFTVITDQQFNGDGSTLSFTLTANATTAGTIVSINGVQQIPVTAYSVSGVTLTFTEAPAPGDLIDVRNLTTTTTVTSISNSSGNAVVAVSPTSAQVNVTGDLSVSGTILGGNINSTAITSGTSNMTVVSSGGNIRANIAGTTVQTISPGLVAITGDLTVSGNATLSGNILGDRIQNGTTQIDIQTPGGNANINIGGTGNLAVFSPGALNMTGNIVPTANVTYNLGSTTQRWNDLWLANSTIYLGNSQISANATSLIFTNPQGGQTVLAGATSEITGASVSVTGAVTAASVVGGVITGSSLSVSGTVTGGNVTTAGQLTVNSGGNAIAIINGSTDGIGNIGSSGDGFNTVFAKATSAQYADLAEKYTADAAYAPGTVLVFGGTHEVTVDATDADRKVAGVVSTNPAYIMNDRLDSEFTATVALTGRVPTRVTGTVRKGDMMVSAGNGTARAEANPQVGTVIGKALADSEGDAVIEVVVGRI